MIIQNRKKLLVSTAIIAFVTIGIMAFKPIESQQPRKCKNLKVFPVNSNYDSVDHLMDEYKVDLGVKCNYCHAPQSKESDANPKKDIARDMIRMTMEMNQKYISVMPHADSVKVQAITCYTCHRGLAKPNLK